MRSILSRVSGSGTPAIQIGPYEPLHEFAVGGMSLLYLGRHTGTGELVVLKQLLPELARNKDHIAMFKAEAQLVEHLKHPNIAAALATFETPVPTIVFEYVDGPHLGRVMRTARALEQLPVEASVYIAHAVALALEAAHTARNEQGERLDVVHRDISPPNILVSHFGDVRVIDFGIARAKKRDYKTEAGILKGKVSYMAPEQVLARSVDARTDVFALGIVLWELLAGRRLYKDPSDLIIMQRVVHDAPVAPSSLRSEVPTECDAVVLRALAKAPEDRFPSAGKFAEAIAGLKCAQNPDAGKRALAEWLERYDQRLDFGLTRNTPSSVQRSLAQEAEEEEGELTGTVSLRGSAVPPPPKPGQPAGVPLGDDDHPTAEAVIETKYFRFDARQLPLLRFTVLGTPDRREDLDPIFKLFEDNLARKSRTAILYDAREYSGLKFPSLEVREAARDFIHRTREASAKYCICFGVLVSSRLFGGFINAVLTKVKGDYPQRVFSDETEALRWVLSQLEKEPDYGLRARRAHGQAPTAPHPVPELPPSSPG